MEVDDDQSKHRQVFNFNLIIVPFAQEPAGKSLVIIIVPFAQEPAEKCVDKSHMIDKSS